jgi:hypothetical protein
MAGSIDAWNGAGASVQVFDWRNSASGATATQSVRGETSIPYWNFNTGLSFTASASGSAAAEAGVATDQLLRVTTHYLTANPGTVTYVVDTRYPVTASASWIGDRVVLHQANPGARLPEAVRVTLGIEFQRSPFGPLDSGLTVLGYNGHELRVSSDSDYGLRYAFQEAGQYAETQPFSGYREGAVPWTSPGFDSVTDTRQNPDDRWSMRILHGTFHTDLLVGADGVSEALNLTLTNLIGDRLTSNTRIYQIQDFVASIEGIALLDGTSLRDASLEARMVSGLVVPGATVPEPTSVAVWGIGGLTACVWGLRRREGC